MRYFISPENNKVLSAVKCVSTAAASQRGNKKKKKKLHLFQLFFLNKSLIIFSLNILKAGSVCIVPPTAFTVFEGDPTEERVQARSIQLSDVHVGAVLRLLGFRTLVGVQGLVPLVILWRTC